jgi:hypothetical protein
VGGVTIGEYVCVREGLGEGCIGDVCVLEGGGNI